MLESFVQSYTDTHTHNCIRIHAHTHTHSQATEEVELSCLSLMSLHSETHPTISYIVHYGVNVIAPVYKLQVCVCVHPCVCLCEREIRYNLSHPSLDYKGGSHSSEISRRKDLLSSLERLHL